MPTALIVEDEPEANRLLSMLVQLRGYETVSAFTGGEALEIVGRRSPDIVFLDLMLPDINGFEVCKALKGRRRTNPIPVVMVTARLAPENRRHGFRVGANEYVPKPYTPDQIFDAMEAADTWRRDLGRDADEGEIRVDTRRDVEPFEQISRLQALLLGRTPLDEECVHRFGLDLSEMVHHVLEWGRRRGVEEAATVRYRLEPSRVTVTIRDLAGWSADGDLPHEQALGLLLGRTRFDHVDYNETGDEVTLSKHCQTG
jgi:CheY-like chemotaxis protein